MTLLGCLQGINFSLGKETQFCSHWYKMLLVTAAVLEKKAPRNSCGGNDWLLRSLGTSSARFPIRLNVHLNKCMACISLYLFYSSV